MKKVLKATNATDAVVITGKVNIWNRFLAQYQGAEMLGDYPIMGRKHGAYYMDWIGSDVNSGYVPLITFFIAQCD